MNTDEKYLILGSNGLIGSEVVENIVGQNHWVGTYCRRKINNAVFCDLLDYKTIQAAFKQVKPTKVIHCANLPGGVRASEEQPAKAKSFYFEATRILAEECQKYDSKFIYLSTECVFDGKQEQYDENSALNPVNEYGKNKADSETWLLKYAKDSFIIRTMSVFGWQPDTETPNALMSAYFAIQQKRKINIPAYRWGTPTYVSDLAKSIVEVSLSAKSGLYQIAGKNFLNRYEWIKKMCDSLGWNTKYLIKDEQSSGKYKYPLRVNLSTKKFEQEFSTILHTLDESIEMIKQKMFTTENRILKI